MKNTLLLIVFWMFAATAAVPVSAQNGNGTAPGVAKTRGPHIKMEVASYDFGDVPRKGGDLVHEFEFINDGDAPLVVMRVFTSCSCIKTSHTKKPVPPGGQGVIKITYEPHKAEPGAFNKVIHIYSNSADSRNVITVQGNSIDGDGTAAGDRKNKKK